MSSLFSQNLVTIIKQRWVHVMIWRLLIIAEQSKIFTRTTTAQILFLRLWRVPHYFNGAVPFQTIYSDSTPFLGKCNGFPELEFPASNLADIDWVGLFDWLLPTKILCEPVNGKIDIYVSSHVDFISCHHSLRGTSCLHLIFTIK